MKNECLGVINHDGIKRIILSQPQKRNALSEAMMAELAAALGEAEKDSQTRAIVLAAEGPVFCAGHDLKEMTAARNHADRGQAYYTKVMATCSALMQQIVSNPKPVIAEVSGIATAAGCQLVASCDLAIASRSAKFATPGVHIGLFCSTPMVALTRNLSRKHAMEMLLTGEMIDAEKAMGVGLINRVVADADVTSCTMEMAQIIAAKSTATVAIGKRAFYQQIDMPLEQAYAYAANVMVENMMKRDAKEGIDAFIEKRDPNWTGQ